MRALKLSRFLLVALWCSSIYAQAVPDEQLVVDAERSALAAYLDGRNEAAVTLLRRVISLYEQALTKTKTGDPMNLAIKYDLLLAHGRLALVHGRRDEATERDRNLEQALAYGRESMRPPLKSIADVPPLIASVDRNHAKR
jgi:hypothetical protein